jgi:short-subunit dehydrogenase
MSKSSPCVGWFERAFEVIFSSGFLQVVCFNHSGWLYDMFPYRGHTALITGASIGIGEEFARVLAARGMNLVLVARNTDQMNVIASDLRAKHGTQVHVIGCDLSRDTAATELADEVRKTGVTVDLLINNAGFMTYGPFETIDPAQEHKEIMVNITAMVDLTHIYLPGMLGRRMGGVINVASIAGFQPIPLLTTYAATKAFVISFSVALWEECRGRNVRVLGLCPGTTKTELFERASAQNAAVGGVRTVQQVVATALKALDRKKSLVVDGFKNKLLTEGPRFIPRWFAAICAGQAVKAKK